MWPSAIAYSILQGGNMQKKHQPYDSKMANHVTAVVFIHGILEGPEQFCDLIVPLEENYSVYNLLLPGHGGSGKEFAKSSMRQWQQHLDDTIIRLERRYKNIILVGHSMGCLLAIQTAIEFPQKIRGLFLLAVPLHIRLTMTAVKNSLGVAFGHVGEEDVIGLAAQKACSVSRSSLVTYITWLPRYLELLKKSRLARNQLWRLHLPVMIFQSSHDELISVKSIHALQKLPYATVQLCPSSGHFYYVPEERRKIVRNLCSFVALTADSNKLFSPAYGSENERHS